MRVLEKPKPYLHLMKINKGFACYPQDHQFVADCQKQIPNKYRSVLIQRYNDLIRSKGQEDANEFLSSLADVGRCAPIDPKSTFASISDQAHAIARACERSMRECDSIDESHSRAVGIIKNYGLTFHAGVTPLGAVKRVCCDSWWFKKLRFIHWQLLEEFAVKLRQVSKFAQVYASNGAVSENKRQKMRNADFLAAMEAVSELGDRIALSELRERSLANPANRRVELMARMSGFESYAISRGYVGLFVTLTCPSKMHPVLSRSGKANPKYDQTTPKEAHQYLMSIWTRIRAKWNRLSLKPYGMRIVEPQHDATPHWHLMMFVEASQANEVLEILREYALKVDGNEPGAAEHRVKVVPVDYQKGSATGYVAKYVCKNIDGVFNDEDTSGIDGTDAALRVNSWAKIWRIRQFQAFGGPPVGVWRELRRIGDAKIFGVLQEAATKADESDWEGYMDAMGGIEQGCESWPITLEKVWSDKTGAYGDPSGYRTLGLTSEDQTIVTRPIEWSIERKPAPLGALEFCQ